MPVPHTSEPALRGGFPRQQQDAPGITGVMEPQPDHGESSYVGHERLDGKRTFITGGDSGIGRAVAIAFAREGADVAFTFQADESEDAEEMTRLIEAAGSTAIAIEADLRNRQICEHVLQEVVSRLGGLDVLVNNAGYQFARRSSIDDMTDEQIERVLATNLQAMFVLTREAMPHLRDAGGNIINVSSIQAYEPSTSLLDYAATKAAINNFTVNLAQEAGSDGVRVNAVAPGPIWTPLQPATQAPERLDSFGQDTPLGRAGQPAECAPAFVFFASEETASYVSGTVLGVTGGKGVF